jgi:biopolymer transport protein ExbB
MMRSSAERTRLGLTCLMLCLALLIIPSTTGNAQSSSAPPAAAPASGNAAGPGSLGPPKRRTLLDVIIYDGGTIGAMIILLSVAAIGLIIEHFVSIRRGKLMPDLVMYELEELIQNHKIDEAIDVCDAAGNDCLVAAVVRAALVRYQGAQFGFAEYKAAAEEAGESQIGRLYRKTTALALIAAIAPMLGLTGTVMGMITSFNTIAATGGMARPDELASGIGQALITTLEGLCVAMPSMVAVSFFRNRIDSLAAEAGSRVEQILLPLSHKRQT